MGQGVKRRESPHEGLDLYCCWFCTWSAENIEKSVRAFDQEGEKKNNAMEQITNPIYSNPGSVAALY